MAKRKLVKSNAEKGAHVKEQRRRSKEVGLPTGTKSNTEKAIVNAAKKKGVDVPKDNTDAEKTLIENRGKNKTAGRPVSTVKKKLGGQLRDIQKAKNRKGPTKEVKKKVIKNKKRAK